MKIRGRIRFLLGMLLGVALGARMPLFAEGDQIKKSQAKKEAKGGGDEDPKAKAALRRLSDYYKGLKSYTVDVEMAMQVDMGGMNQNMSVSMNVAVKRPNKFSIVTKGGGMMAMMGSNMVSDGTNLYNHMAMWNKFTVEKAPATLEDLSSTSGMGGGMGGGGGAGGGSSTFIQLSKLAETAEHPKFVGVEELDGVKCDHVRYTENEGMLEMPVDLWFESGEKPLVHKFMPDMSKLMEMTQKMMSGDADEEEEDDAAKKDRKVCRENLEKIDAAKQRWALENNRKPGDAPLQSDLYKSGGKGYLKEWPKCPSDGNYVINSIGAEPVCSSGLPGHTLTEKKKEAKKGRQGGGQNADVMGQMMKDMKMEMSYSYKNWAINPELADEKFKFTPPEGAQKVASMMEAMKDMQKGMPGGVGPGAGAPAEPKPEPEETQLQDKPAPAFKLPLLGGGEFDLAAQKGKNIVILDFWATWCGPCRKAMPIIIESAEAYKGKNVVLIAVNQGESAEKVSKFIEGEKLKVSVALDKEMEVGNIYGATSIPRTVIIDKTGVVRKIHVGFSPELKAELKKELDGLTAN